MTAMRIAPLPSELDTAPYSSKSVGGRDGDGLAAACARSRRACRARRRADLRQDDDLGADAHALVEIDHVLIGEADAPTRYVLADGARIIGAVDPIGGAAEIECACAERIAGAAGDETR